ncbi:MAG: hypothetical protein OEQ12_07735 [Nitrosopumilus sp.]|nr:hypothetical protein [Nitrosopumilus sp.]
MSSEIPQISTPEAILRINKLIETKQGDEGRLRYITETLQKGKQLFHSDRIYLTKKIFADVIPIEVKKPTKLEKKIKDVKRLIASNFGDVERLRYILHTLQNNKPLYHSDEHYLQTKTNQFLELSKGRRIRRSIRSHIPTPSRPERYETEFHDSFSERLEEKTAIQPHQNIPEKLQEIEDAVLSQKVNQTREWFDVIDEVPKINLEIEKERERISKLKLDQEQIKIQREELSQLIIYRQQYEIKINHEKENLEREIKIELEKVKEKDNLVEELIKNQSKIIQTKTEREVLMEQIRIDKEKSQVELKKKQDELDQVKKEYEELQNKIKTKKQFLDEQISQEEEKRDKLKEDSEKS